MGAPAAPTDSRVDITTRRIAVIAPSRFPIAQPFAGGLEAYVSTLTRALRQHGHDVTLFAPAGSDEQLGVRLVTFPQFRASDAARRDVSMPADAVLAEHHAYLSLMLELSRADGRFDQVHNHSLHYLPVAMAAAVSAPMTTTLHTPVTPWLESAVRAANPVGTSFVAVSHYVARAWRPLLGDVPVVRSGVDCGRWQQGNGGSRAVWSGRIVPEKAPHLAIRAARLAGMQLDLAGPISDRDYFRDSVAPLLGGDISYLGHLDQQRLSTVVGRAAVAVVTPEWDEPYGLVVAEALACGTPVAAFDRGGVSEIVDTTCARLVTGGDVEALADAMKAAARLDRAAARWRAELHCSLPAMLAGYEMLLDEFSAA